MVLFCKNSLRLLAVKYFLQKALSWTFNWSSEYGFVFDINIQQFLTELVDEFSIESFHTFSKCEAKVSKRFLI